MSGRYWDTESADGRYRLLLSSGSSHLSLTMELEAPVGAEDEPLSMEDVVPGGERVLREVVEETLGSLDQSVITEIADSLYSIASSACGYEAARVMFPFYRYSESVSAEEVVSYFEVSAARREGDLLQLEMEPWG